MEENHAPQPIKVIREPFLIRNPWFSIAMVLVFYFLFLTVPVLLYASLADSVSTIIVNIISFVSLGLMLFLIIPVFRIPKNNKGLGQYYKDVQLTTISGKSIIVAVVVSLAVLVLGYGSTYLGDFLVNWYLENVEFKFIGVDPGVYTDFGYLIDFEADMNIFYALTPGIMEEMAFRGIILILLLKKHPWKSAIVINGILFGLFHLINLLGPTLDYVYNYISLEEYLFRARAVGFQVIFTSCFGIAWAYLTVKTQSILPAILIHYAVDAFGGLVLTPLITFSIFSSFSAQWLYYISITLLGIGVLPSVMSIFITKLFYKDLPINPWELKAETEFKKKIYEG